MILILTPCRMDGTLTLARAGDVLTVNGVALDFGPLAEGAALPAAATGSPWIAGEVTRTGGVLTVPLILPLGPGASEAARFPAPIDLGPLAGPVALPDCGWPEED